MEFVKALIETFFPNNPEFSLLVMFNLFLWVIVYRKVAGKIDNVWKELRIVQNDNAAIDKTLKIHGDHFDVVDNHIERANRHAGKALTITWDIIKELRTKR